MITFADWFPLATVGLTFTILGSLKLWGLKQGIVGGSDKPFTQTALRDMTHLGEPQSAAGIPTLVPGHRAVQPRLAGVDAPLGAIAPRVCQLARIGSAHGTFHHGRNPR